MTAWFTKKKKTDRLKEILGDYELPRFRKTIFETLQRLREPAATSADIAEVMSLDPDLTSRVMRTVNSTAYAPRTPIKTLDHALTMMGKGELERIVMMLGAKLAAPQTVPHYLDMKAFWQCAGRRAVLAREVAELTHPPEASLCFTAGFLQDFSVPIIAASKGREYAEIFETSAKGAAPLLELEREVVAKRTVQAEVVVLGAVEQVDDLPDQREDRGLPAAVLLGKVGRARAVPIFAITTTAAARRRRTRRHRIHLHTNTIHHNNTMQCSAM